MSAPDGRFVADEDHVDVLEVLTGNCMAEMATFDPNSARNPAMSGRGGAPNIREYSRLNWDGLS